MYDYHNYIKKCAFCGSTNMGRTAMSLWQYNNTHAQTVAKCKKCHRYTFDEY